ncbi:MAG: transglycosylase domain-containing protein [Alphaproteobacteria bacterium]|nr:transglycosylase domain-containing protein [Alphaproteobacteria bacterium]
MDRRRGGRPKPLQRAARKGNTSFAKILFKYAFYFAFSGFVAIGLVLLYFSRDLPDLQNLTTAVRVPAVTIQTYDGKIVGSYGDLYEDVVRVENLPKHVPAAFMAVEDKRFFQHFGIDVIGFTRAFYQNYVAHRVVQGGSTITQQLAKNILIAEGVVTHYDRSIGRKIKELLLAFWLEYKFTKSEILMMYLNRVYFGAGTYGIDAASKKYFGKPATKLSIFEAAILAGLLKAPTKYNPSNHPNYAHERALIVLRAMEEQGYIKSVKEVEQREAKVVFAEKGKSQQNFMYFCDYVYEQAKKILGEIEDDIVVVTTLDEQKQRAAEEAVEFFLKTEGEKFKFKQASFICLNRDGAVQALVGGNGYSSSQFNRAVQANRMPGSAFKIFIYGAAIEHGYQLDDMISDAPFSIAGWKPRNYKWRTRGQISVLEGFTHSVNAVSARLAQAVGLPKVARFAGKLGITGVSTHDMSVALGTTPVTLKDLTAAYTSFMDGLPIWTYCITEIRTKSGDVLFQKNKERLVPVLDDETLTACRALLRGVVRSGTGRAANVNNYVYGKTGTNGDSDAWFVGFYDPPKAPNNGFSLGVWVGNDTNKEEMSANSTGGRVPTWIAKMFLQKVLTKGKTSSVEKIPASNKTVPQKNLGSLLEF